MRRLALLAMIAASPFVLLPGVGQAQGLGE